MNVFTFLSDHPLALGLLIGVAGIVAVAINGWLRLRHLKKYLQTHLAMTDRANRDLLKENDELKKRCANLETSMAALSQKPSAVEMKTFYAYDRALHLLFGRMPGFATAWESALAEAQNELSRNDEGFLPFVKRVLHPSLFAAKAKAPAVDADELVPPPGTEAESPDTETPETPTHQ